MVRLPRDSGLYLSECMSVPPPTRYFLIDPSDLSPLFLSYILLFGHGEEGAWVSVVTLKIQTSQTWYPLHSETMMNSRRLCRSYGLL